MKTDDVKYNLGLELIRLLMCYAVVATHFWNFWTFYPQGGAPWPLVFVNAMRPYAVPVFMLMTFFLTSARFLSADGAWFSDRIRRLLVPFVGWTLITFVVFRSLMPLSAEFTCTLRDLWLQQLLGTTKALGAQMWFQAVLVILTVFFGVLFRFVKPQRAVLALTVVFLLAEGMEYSGLNFLLFKDGIYEVRNPLGRIFPMMAYASVGLLLGMAKGRADGLSSRVRWSVVTLGFGLVVFLLNFKVFVVPDGFYYRGLQMLVIAVALVGAFGLLPTGRVPQKATEVLLMFSRYSMGVYFTHILIGRILTVFAFPVLGLMPKCFCGTFVVYFVSWAFCYTFAKVLPKRFKGLVQ